MLSKLRNPRAALKSTIEISKLSLRGTLAQRLKLSPWCDIDLSLCCK
jgi:hypothetical protein